MHDLENAYTLNSQYGAGIAAEVGIVAMKFWVIGVGLSVLGLFVMIFGGQQTSGILDYRAWLLIAFGLLALVIGNFGETAHRDR